MPLETFNFLDSLVPANPAVSDGIVQGDYHIRGIKLTLKNTFPNITGAVTGTQVALNAAAAWTTAGVNLLDHRGAFFDNGSGAASTDGFLNTTAGDVDVVLQNNVAFTFQRTGGANFLKVHGQIISDGEIKGPGITPIGAAVMWFEDVLPTDGLWAWANGQVIANANIVAPVLLARWGNRFGGNGVTTMGVPDMQEVVPVGKSGMGGAASPGLLSSIAIGVKDVLNSVFGSDTKTILTANLPPYTPAGTITNGALTLQNWGSVPSAAAFSGNNNGGGGGTFGVISGAAPVPFVTQGTSTFTGTAQGGTNTPLGIVQPSKAVNWIVRLG